MSSETQVGVVRRARRKTARSARRRVSVLVAGLLIVAGWVTTHAAAVEPAKSPLKLRISLLNASVTEPYPARARLEFQNTGSQTLWLYRPIQTPERKTWRAELEGGSSLVVKLAPVNRPPIKATPGRSCLLNSVGYPHPELMPVPPGGEVTQVVLLHLSPVGMESLGRRKRFWGMYRLSVDYRANFPDQAQFVRATGAELWEGEIHSNTVTVGLAPSQGKGTIEGSVLSSVVQPLPYHRVTLSTAHEEPLEEILTDAGGQFAFHHLPWGLYWTFASGQDGRTENRVYRHAVLKPSTPRARLHLMLIPKHAYNTKRLLHKPVLLRVVNASGQPLDGIHIEDLFANGRVVEKLQSQTASDGTAVLSLIPGRNFITLRRRGCHSEERLADVAYHGRVSGYQYKFRCRKK